MKKVAGLVVILIVAAIGFVMVKLLNPQNNGVEEFSRFNEVAVKNGVSCNYVGFAYLRKVKKTDIYVACEKPLEIDANIQSQDALKKFLNEEIVMPNLSGSPSAEDMLLIVIMQIQDNVVLCTGTNSGKIVDSWYDSYENYCLP